MDDHRLASRWTAFCMQTRTRDGDPSWVFTLELSTRMRPLSGHSSVQQLAWPSLSRVRVEDYLRIEGRPASALRPPLAGAQRARRRWVLGVAGTHGKTTTTSLLTWILEHAGLEPGFLVGGVPLDFNVSARLGAGRHFVVEADEYDTAFFDKRAKFVHYRPARRS